MDCQKDLHVTQENEVVMLTGRLGVTGRLDTALTMCGKVGMVLTDFAVVNRTC